MRTPPELHDAVRDDVTEVLARWLPAGDVDDGGFSVPDEFRWARDSAIANEEFEVAVVPWEWRGTNSEGLFDLDPTFAPVTVRGSTIVTEVDGTLLFRRYIDWLDVLAQAGVAVYTRPIVDIRQGFDRDALEEIPELARALREVEGREAEGA